MVKTIEVKKKICLIGDPAVGKTSLIRKYVTDIFDDKYIGTLGTKVTKKRILIEQRKVNFDLTLAIWDILGQREFQRIQNMAYRGAKGVFLVSDGTRLETLLNLKTWKNSIVQITDEIPAIIISNKSDLTEEQAYNEDEIKVVAAELDRAPYLITSAKTGNNVDKAFYRMAEFVIQDLDDFE